MELIDYTAKDVMYAQSQELTEQRTSPIQTQTYIRKCVHTDTL